MVVGVLALALVPALAALHSRSFFSPDETNYTQVAREMLETGDLVVPHLDGHAWFNKPPLAYWLLAGSFALLGWGFPAAVLLNTLLTGLTAALLLVHVRSGATPRAGVLAAVAYLTMALPITVGRTALTDPSLVLCTTAAIVLFLRQGRWTAVLSGIGLGLGVLAKGPVAPLVVLPALLAKVWQGDRRVEARRLAAAVVTATLVVAPWQLALAAGGVWPAWAREFIANEVVARATETWRISAPWWYYLPVLWVAAFPWGTHLALLVGACVGGDAAAPCRERRDLPELAAMAVPIVAFSIATNKLPHYLLPLFPFFAAWLGRAGDRLWEQDRVPAPRWVAVLVAGLGGGSLAVAAWLAVTSRFARFLPPGTGLVLAVAALAFAGLGVLEGTGRRRAAWMGMVLLALALRLGLDVAIAPWLDRQVPERPIAESARASLPEGGVPIAHRWWRTAFLTYGARGWVQTETRDQLAGALRDARSRARSVVVVVRSDSEGEARAAAWAAGGELQERSRTVGLGEVNGETIEGIVFAALRSRSGERWFYDADAPAEGVAGFSGVEGNPWTASFRWSTEPVATLFMAAAPHGAAVLRLCAWGAADGADAQRVEVTINGRAAAVVVLGTVPSVHAIPVPRELLRPEGQLLSLAVRHLVVPASRQPGSTDERALGMALDWVALDPATPTTTLIR